MIKELNTLLDNQVVKIGVPVESGDSRYICFYVQKDGSCPTEEFLEGLLERKNLEELEQSNESKTASEQIVAKLLDYLNRWIRKGNIPKVPGNYRSLTSHLSEVKAYQGRLLLFYDGKICVVTHGYFKKTQKTPKREIKKAQAIFDNYQERKRKLLKGELK